ncbi:hypothetical protein [Lysobacter enzymogenes]|uniref:hypothetical protein n=1 Tax=Lysobacter enzymogenes TaxID=69 RepID=UPI0011163A88|nr:hypothetical protein [Lysobacter enzymogenes]UZW62741.1 hypothetical protein BV903_010800 [Lysobacter enzymogenes]
MAEDVRLDPIEAAKRGGEPAPPGNPVVCTFKTNSVRLTSELWSRVLAEYKRLGRTLTDAELQRIIHADRGDNRD